MTYPLIKKLLDQYLEKNHPEIDFYNDNEFNKLVSIHGINYRFFLKPKPFCSYEKNIAIERASYCKANPYNHNWLDENEEKEEKLTSENSKKIPHKEETHSDVSIVDMCKIPRKRRIVKENMFNEDQGGKAMKIYKCELPGCNRQYTSSFGLKYHMKEGHSEEKLNVHKPFVCPMDLCGRKYKNNNGLKYHLKNYHDIE